MPSQHPALRPLLVFHISLALTQCVSLVLPQLAAVRVLLSSPMLCVSFHPPVFFTSGACPVILAFSRRDAVRVLSLGLHARGGKPWMDALSLTTRGCYASELCRTGEGASRRGTREGDHSDAAHSLAHKVVPLSRTVANRMELVRWLLTDVGVS
jgi:hypothetical protein